MCLSHHMASAVTPLGQVVTFHPEQSLDSHTWLLCLHHCSQLLAAAAAADTACFLKLLWAVPFQLSGVLQGFRMPCTRTSFSPICCITPIPKSPSFLRSLRSHELTVCQGCWPETTQLLNTLHRLGFLSPLRL